MIQYIQNCYILMEWNYGVTNTIVPNQARKEYKETMNSWPT